MKQLLLLFCFSFAAFIVEAQTKLSHPPPTENKTSQTKEPLVEMPYNRLLQSAGKVVTYGDPDLENHALDVTVLPDRKNVVVEDRYGIAILDIKTKKITNRWSFSGNAEYKDLMSTYSGIASFIYKNSTYITWSAVDKGKNLSHVMIAQWDGMSVKGITSIALKTIAPAATALPNQINIRFESGIPYLYVVLNGNNQLIKINVDTKQIAWTAGTGVAPFGICIINDKAYVTNWGGRTVTDTTMEFAGTPWGRAYTNPATGAVKDGSLSVIDISNGSLLNELQLGLHPNAITCSPDKHFLYVANGNSDYVSVINAKNDKVVDSIEVGLFSKQYSYYGSSPNALVIDATGKTMYVANGLDNAIAVINLGKKNSYKGIGKTKVKGYIPTEAYPSGIALLNRNLYIANLEAKGARVLSEPKELEQASSTLANAYTIHKELASLSIIPLPSDKELKSHTEKVRKLNMFYRIALTNRLPRKNVQPRPLPERIGEPSIFKHVVYIIKENKTYDQVFGDMKQGRGDSSLCIFGNTVTPNQHKLAQDFSLMDNYYASGKSSAEGHVWANAAMVPDYIEKNVRAWFRSYTHRLADAMAYNKNGFVWTNALDHGKKVRIFGEACLTNYDDKMKWEDIYNKYTSQEPLVIKNTTTIARIRPVISPDYPDCDNINFTDQLRADVFIKEWKNYENLPGDSLPELMVLSLPNDHTAGTSPGFPIPSAMVADNDLALGRIVETITKSRFWDSTVVFVTEDDSQSGWDHISSYRTTGLVMSPYSILNKTIHTNYNQTCMVRTIEQILGLSPMNIIDATAMPMFDCFSDKKSNYNYSRIPNKIRLNEMNKPLSLLKGKAKIFAKLSADAAFKEVDGGDDDNMNRILWFDAKGDKKYPVSK
ncbi:bifunctional YncE family protein/alkaline phosphatase family protein [Segetibacter koreensis]|uniref:bifunctional YncE family protein/alkaline phosphatase family protein n=1 Tax=Segetibacter koreensis TaxID=398037 RepID=UPI00035C336E|nr:bifunctional YncE family protein/alkaline phosphatase family protein [Segetibacter koreensis]